MAEVPAPVAEAPDFGPHSFLGAGAALAEGLDFDLGVRHAIRCTYGCRAKCVAQPAAHMDRICRDGAWLDAAASASCPHNARARRPALPPPPPPPAAPAPQPQPAAPVFADAVDWSPATLRAPPPVFTDDEIDEASGALRRPDATESRLDEGKTSVSARISDGFTEKMFANKSLVYPKESWDTSPKRLAAAASRRLARMIGLQMAWVSAVTADSPQAAAARLALGALRVDVSPRFPGTEMPGVKQADQATWPSALTVAQAVTCHGLEADGLLLEASHFPNALKAADVAGDVHLQGSQNALASVQVRSAFARMYEDRLDADETTDPPLRFPSFRDTIRVSAPARLSLLYRTNILWLSRKRMFQLHWRWFWHNYTLTVDAYNKSQSALQAAFNTYRDKHAQLEVLGHHGAAAPGPGRDSGKPGAPDAAAEASAAAALLARKEANNKRASERKNASAAKKPKLFSGDARPTSAITSGALAPLSPKDPNYVPVCRAASGCSACSAQKDARHKDDCSWVKEWRAARPPSG